MVYWPFREMFSDIRNMQITTSQKTRQCPFCAETILAAAMKCRHCGEFLHAERVKTLLSENTEDSQAQLGEVLFTGRPTSWVMMRKLIKGALLFAVAVVLIVWHIERVLNLPPSQAVVFGKYRFLAGLLLALFVVLAILHKVLQIRMTSYAVSADRIEYSTGVFSHRIDNLDMFRVVDIKLRRSVFDRIVGVGTVTLTTTDKSHPEFVFEKVRNSRELYDIIKKASLSADRRTNVIHME
jgi:membrane protein YdbS with pleckstrin-like domain